MRAQADPCVADHSGWNSLMAACHGGHTRIATVLLQRTNLHHAASDGTTSLHAAAQAGRTETVRLLLHKSADPAATDLRGRRALDLAHAGTSTSHSEVAQLLLPVTPPPPPRQPTSRLASHTLFIVMLVLAFLFALA